MRPSGLILVLPVMAAFAGGAVHAAPPAAENVRLIGFTESGPVKERFPFELQGMVILEDAGGRRILIQAKQI